MNTYILATIKDWNIRNFHKIASEIRADWHLVTDEEDLTFEKITYLSKIGFQAEQ